jgi:hypothetical protein
MQDLIFIIVKDIREKISKYEGKVIISLLFFFFAIYCYWGTLPKHFDFWGIIAPGNPLFSGISGINVYYSPIIGIFFRVWIDCGVIFFHLNLNNWIYYFSETFSEPRLIQDWCIIPFLLMLLFLIVVSYITLKNKWLTFLCFGTFSFVSIIILGQVDIWDCFWIYIAMILALKSLESGNNLKFVFLSVLALGLSMQFKPFAGLIFPVFFVFFLKLLQEKPFPAWTKCMLLIYATLEFIFVSFISRIIWPHYISPSGGEAMWLFNFQFISNPGVGDHTILIWLLGYLLILYDLWITFQGNNRDQLKISFIFYIFAVFAWFFISVYSFYMWWLILVPPLLLILDNFENKVNYVFYMAISGLFLLYALPEFPVTSILYYYMPVFNVSKLFVDIVATTIFAILLLWIFELRKNILINQDDIIPTQYTNSLRIIAPIFPAVLLICLFILILIFGQPLLSIHSPPFFT